MIGAQFKGLLECLLCLLVLLLLLEQEPDVDEGFWVLVVILPGLSVVIEGIVNLPLIVVGTCQVKVALS
jgi:hypothetical protein